MEHVRIVDDNQQYMKERAHHYFCEKDEQGSCNVILTSRESKHFIFLGLDINIIESNLSPYNYGWSSQTIGL